MERRTGWHDKRMRNQQQRISIFIDAVSFHVQKMRTYCMVFLQKTTKSISPEVEGRVYFEKGRTEVRRFAAYLLIKGIDRKEVIKSIQQIGVVGKRPFVSLLFFNGGVPKE